MYEAGNPRFYYLLNFYDIKGKETRKKVRVPDEIWTHDPLSYYSMVSKEKKKLRTQY